MTHNVAGYRACGNRSHRALFFLSNVIERNQIRKPFKPTCLVQPGLANGLTLYFCPFILFDFSVIQIKNL